MFNCYAVVLNGNDFAYFKTEMAADNFISLYNSVRTPISNMIVLGRYIPGVF